MWGKDRVCILLEFGSDKRLERYETQVEYFQSDYYENCTQKFYSQDQLEEFERARIAKVENRAYGGDAEAMFLYAREFDDHNQKFKWYCLAAHHGLPKARNHLGNYYRRGLPPISPDPVQAYLWYSLAGADMALFKIEGITPAQIAEAERLVAEWEPNPTDCEVHSERTDN